MQHQLPVTYHLPQDSLPLTGNVALYARVAVQDLSYQKVGITEREAFTAFAKQLGWSQEQIIVFPRDTSSPQGDDLTTLCSAIEQGDIQAILLFDEYQLFQYANEAQINTFIRLCLEKNVAVITLELVYHFTNPLLERLFRSKCEAAPLYLGEILNRMQIDRRYRATM